MEDSWENWISLLGTSSGCSSLSFEEVISSNNNNKIADKSLKRGLENKNELLEVDDDNKRGTKKKGRNASDHIMSERKRRQEIAERLIALSATIPGLKKMDKASVLEEAINYVKQLQQRISLLEKQTNNNKGATKKPLTIIKKSSQNSDDDANFEMLVPLEVEARGLENEVLIRIHVEKRKGIMLKLLPLLETNHLNVASTTILPFGNSALNIIIIAQMTEEFSLSVEDLVKTLKHFLMKYMTCSCGPC